MLTAECRVAVEQLLAYLEDPKLYRANVDTAIRHMRECPHCESRIGHLARALNLDEVDQLTCQECQDLLPDYLQAETTGRVGEPRGRLVALHLETCPNCPEVYDTLSGLAALAFGEQGEEPPPYPAPDLSFLRPASPGIPWHLNDLGHLIIEFSADLVRAFRPLTYQPAYATIRHKSDQSRKILCQLSLKGAVEDLEVTIIAEETREDAAYCMVMVEADIPSRGGWPHLADTEVTLKRGDKEPETQLTDAFGKAVFEGIATDDLDHLVFEISPGERET
jgi:hypothetical protein